LLKYNGDGPGIENGGPGFAGAELVNVSTDLDRIPRATVQPSPQYPEKMRKDGIVGSVTVEFDVDSSGRVYRAEATRYTNMSFVEPAVRAVLRWHFEPGRRHGRAVPFRMAVPVEFGTGAD
jgi:protein TonB